MVETVLSVIIPGAHAFPSKDEELQCWLFVMYVLFERDLLGDF
jgi:hypothetical protein